jgi:predicted aspartyl protease
MRKKRAVFQMILALVFVGCATQRVEFEPRPLTPAQIEALKKRGQPPEALGITMANTPQGLVIGNLAEVVGTQTATLPLMRRNELPVVNVNVHGRANVPMLLDSGSNRTLLEYSLAHSLQIPLIGTDPKPVQAHGIGGTVESYLALIPTIRVGADIEFRRILTMISPEVSVLKQKGLIGRTSFGIWGMDSLRKLSYLTIDGRYGTATFEPQTAYGTANPRQLVFTRMKFVDDLPVIEVMLDRKGPFEAVLDTGGNYALFVPQPLAEQLGYLGKSGQLRTAAGIGGVTLAQTYTVRSLQIGNGVILNVPAKSEVLTVSPLSGQRCFIGNQLLRQYKVTFDFRNGLLWLER